MAQKRRIEKWMRKFIVAGCAATLAICGVAAVMAGGMAREHLVNGSDARAAAHGQSAPFRAGELLDYRVEWSAFSSAASLQLAVPERRNLYGWDAWHFRASIHTLGSVRSLFEIDDQFDSYSVAETFESRQFEQYLNELGRKQKDVIHFAESGEPPEGPGPVVVVLPGTRDPLGALYDLRAIDWDRTPEFRAPVYDGKNMYQMSARREAADEPVTVAGGQFSASRISIQIFQYQRPVAGIHFEIWLANNADRVPVVMRADLPFGHLRAGLISEKN